jgi:solute carrier family 25 (mitochondrial oxoglutarate transporter), member 11
MSFFELEDIRRRHTVYFNEYNTNGFIDLTFESWRWNYKRGAIVGLTASILVNIYNIWDT